MKVLNCLHRGDLGGAQRRVVWVAERLESYGVETVILFPKGGDGRYESWLRERRSRYISLFMPVIRKASRWGGNILFVLTFPLVVIRIMRVARSERAQLLHVNGVTNLQPVVAGMLLRVPVLWHWNDMLTPSWFVKLVRPFLNSHFVKLAVATPAILDHYDCLGSYKETAQIIRAPIPLRSEPIITRNHAYEALQIPADAKVCGFVGNLLPAKGCMDYLLVMSNLVRRSKDIYGVMVGGELPGYRGYSQELQKAIEEMGLGSHVFMVGFQGDVKSWLNCFDLLIFPSHSEACPITVLEAMQCQIPIASYRVGDVQHMLNGSGLGWLEVGDTEGMVDEAERILNLASDRRNAITDHLMVVVNECYSVDAIANKHLESYRMLLGSPSSSPLTSVI